VHNLYPYFDPPKGGKSAKKLGENDGRIAKVKKRVFFHFFQYAQNVHFCALSKNVFFLFENAFYHSKSHYSIHRFSLIFRIFFEKKCDF